MCDGVAFESAGVLEVELLQRFPCWEPGGADAAFTAVRLTSRHLALQTRHQVFLMAPVLRASPLRESDSGLTQRWSFESSCQVGDLSRNITARRGGLGCHQATPPSRSTPSAAS